MPDFLPPSSSIKPAGGGTILGGLSADRVGQGGGNLAPGGMVGTTMAAIPAAASAESTVPLLPGPRILHFQPEMFSQEGIPALLASRHARQAEKMSSDYSGPPRDSREENRKPDQSSHTTMEFAGFCIAYFIVTGPMKRSGSAGRSFRRPPTSCEAA
jgi:hypothetical protein